MKLLPYLLMHTIDSTPLVQRSFQISLFLFFLGIPSIGSTPFSQQLHFHISSFGFQSFKTCYSSENLSSERSPKIHEPTYYRIMTGPRAESEFTNHNTVNYALYYYHVRTALFTSALARLSTIVSLHTVMTASYIYFCNVSQADEHTHFQVVVEAEDTVSEIPEHSLGIRLYNQII